MLIVGVTGGIGSGKSLVCSIIGAMGYPVYHADTEAKNLTDSDKTIIEGIKELFGNDIYQQGHLNRKKVAQLVFANNLLLPKLNKIIHPLVEQDFSAWVQQNSSSKLLFEEAAILFESGAYRLMDKIISVIAPEDIRIKRVVERDGVTVQEVKNRIAHQLCEEELVKRSDYIIRNDGSEPLIPKIHSVITQILAIT